MGVEDDKPINLLEVQPEVTEEEPIEQVFSQEWTVEPSTESEDKERLRKLQNLKKRLTLQKLSRNQSKSKQENQRSQEKVLPEM
jgi:hypothetical protein